jgi:ABC-type sugar transport system, auxiliary component
MKRSEINSIQKDAKAFLAEKRFLLPPWAYWSVEDWKKNQDNAKEIIDNMLGWDITDFGSGDFYKRGLFLFTLRNGKLNVDKKPYAEKIMIVYENQETPMHFHWFKMEDIINRGGGNLIIELYNSTKDEQFDTVHPVCFKKDGIKNCVQPGGEVILAPGESISLEQGMYHRFYGEPGKGIVMVGEVSQVNDDNTDNRFFEPVGRFPEVEEDEKPLYLLGNEYKKFL